MDQLLFQFRQFLFLGNGVSDEIYELIFVRLMNTILRVIDEAIIENRDLSETNMAYIIIRERIQNLRDSMESFLRLNELNENE